MIRGFSSFFQGLANVAFGQPQNDPPYGSIDTWLDYYRLKNKEKPDLRGDFDVNACPKVSILVLTYNNLLFNQLCLESIYTNTVYPNFEVIVVDNASTDGTPEWLKRYSTTRPNLHLILNSENKGFAAGNNQAAREATGEYLIFLNNDTVVTNGWIEGLLDHLRVNPQVGLVGPVTNSTGNEARIITSYKTPKEMEIFADQQRRNMSGQSFDIRMLAFYCVMVRKAEFETLGGLDERYGVGMFEDDDLALQYNKAGFKALCAEDVFIHHFQGASFGKMQNADYLRVFSENRQKYEAKWEKKWEPYQLRPEVMQHLLKSNAVGSEKVSQSTLFAFLLGIIWALYVIVRYVGIDDGFLFDKMKEWNALSDVIKYLLVSSGVFGFGLILRNIVDENPRRRLAGVLFAGIIGIAFVYFGEQAADFWLQWMNLFDGVKVSLLLACFSIFGMGLGFGSRIGNSPLKFWLLPASLLVPFLIITTLAGALLSLLGLIWIFLLSFIIGETFLLHLAKFFKIASQQIENKMGLLPLAVGLGIMVLGALILGSFGAASNVGVILFLAIITMFCLSRFPGIFGRLKLTPWNQPINVNEIELGALFLLAALFTVYWVGALAPEVGADAIGQRVAVPAMWLREGIIRPLPEMLFSYNFISGEVVYFLIMPFAGFTAAKVTQFALGLVLVIGAFFEVFEFRHRRSLALYLFAFWGSTVVWWQMIWGFVDLVQLFFYFSSILAVRYWLDDQKNPVWLIMAGIIGGLAASISLNGLGAVVIAGMASIGISLYRTRSFMKAVLNGLYVFIPALLSLTVWLICYYIATGTPVFSADIRLDTIFDLRWKTSFEVPASDSWKSLISLSVLGIFGLFAQADKKNWLWLLTGGIAGLFGLVVHNDSTYVIVSIYLLSIAINIGLSHWQDMFRTGRGRTSFQIFIFVILIIGFIMQSATPAF